jgi:hypothetical protein
MPVELKKYKAITFAKDYSGTLEQFKAEFENTWVFRGIPEKERLVELKKAFKIATSDTKAIVEK